MARRDAPGKSDASEEDTTSIFDMDDLDPGVDANDASPLVDADSQMEAIEASIVGTLKVLNDNEKPTRLTMQLIRQSMSMAIRQSGRRLVTEDDCDGEDEPRQLDGDDGEALEIDSLLQKRVLRLDWMSLGRIENLEAFTHIHELYLQHNVIEKIENLDDHAELTFLALGDNRIKRVENIKHLTKLKFLDLSNNAIDDFDSREFPPSLVILRLAGNPFTRHMPAYMHLFFERLPKLTQIDQFRRAPSHLADASPVGSPLSTSPLSYSPRSAYCELEMEIEMSRKDPPASTEASKSPGDDQTTAEWNFNSSDYEKEKLARMATWRQQLKDLETRKAELEGDIPVITRSTSASSLRARRKVLVANARESTQAAIADSIAHFQEMELQHQEWQEQQHQAA